MTRPGPGAPCGGRSPIGPLPDGSRVRVVELLATGTNGGAQESVVNTMVRLDSSRHEAIVVSLSHGSTVARLRKLGFVAEVIEDDGRWFITSAGWTSEVGQDNRGLSIARLAWTVAE